MALNHEPHIALVGGGYTLQRVAHRLAAGSFVITSRSQEQCAEWHRGGWHSYQLSLEDGNSVRDFFKSHPHLTVLVDSVPPLHTGSPAAGVERVVSAIEGSKVSKIIYLSTTGVFGYRDGREVTEATPPQPWNAQGQARLLSEDVYRQWATQHSNASFTALRLPAIYGPDRGVVFSIRSGTYRLIDNGSLWTNRIHVDDLAHIIERCIEVSGLPDVLCVSDDCPALAHEVVSFVCTREGLPMPSSITSEDAIRRGAYTMVSNQIVRNSLMKSLLGVQLQYPTYRQGLWLDR